MDGQRQGWPRRAVLRAVGCCGFTALGLTGLAGAQSLLPSGASARRNAWAAAQKPIDEAAGMAERITRTLDSLTSTAATASRTKDTVQAELAKLADEIAAFVARKERLLEEYRNGLFCSGCNKTKSEILAKGETFPHPGQSIIRPTPAQIAAKERELQEPIDRAQSAEARGKKTFKDASDRQDLAFAQIRAGVALWRTSISYWRGSVHRGMREHDGELKAAIREFHNALDAEMQQLARRKASDVEARAEAAVWQRLLDKQRLEIDEFKSQSHKALVDVFERAGAQKTAISGYLQKAPLPRTLLAVVVVDAPVGSGRSPGELGVDYRLGELPALQNPGAALPPLAPVARIVADFKSANLPEAPQAPALATGAPPAATPAQAVPAQLSPARSRLLDALP